MSSTTTELALPYPSGPSQATDIPGDMQALAERVEAVGAGAKAMTTTVRNALAGADLWTNRIIWNVTTGQFERYTGAVWAPTLRNDTYSNATADRQVSWGAGSPEGAVTGSIGSLYLQTNGAAGFVLWVKETGTATNTGWKTGGSKTVRLAWTYTLPGDIKVPSGQTDFLPFAQITVPTGQSVTLVGYRWYLSSGTSFTFSMKHKTGSTLGTNTDLVTGVVAASASVKGSGTFGTPKVCADGDAWLPVITAVSGTPNGGSVAMIADVTF